MDKPQEHGYLAEQDNQHGQDKEQGYRYQPSDNESNNDKYQLDYLPNRPKHSRMVMTTPAKSSITMARNQYALS